MGICRDSFGRLSYTAVNKRNQVFSVENGWNKIISHQPYYRTDATLYDPDFLWIDLPEFSSFVQAVRYLKENLENLQ